jgi:hypothetical protein
MTMMISGQPCERIASYLETFIRTVIALPSQAIPLIINCSPLAPCDAQANKHWTGTDLEKELGRCSRHNHTERAKEFSVSSCKTANATSKYVFSFRRW